MGSIPAGEGKAQKLHALIVSLSSSRYAFVWPTLRQTTDDVCAGLDAARRFFTAVPKHVVLDNATATDPGQREVSRGSPGLARRRRANRLLFGSSRAAPSSSRSRGRRFWVSDRCLAR
jgi:transposase